MKRCWFAMLALLFLLIAAACSSSYRAQDSNTHWLRCRQQRDCPAELSCVQGFCMPPETADAATPTDAMSMSPAQAAASDAGNSVTDAGAIEAPEDGGSGQLGPVLMPLLAEGEPCMHTDECAAGLACEQGSCALPECPLAPGERPPCSAAGTCSDGEVCHIDGTCIEPGTCDEQGRTTLASVGEIVAIELTADLIYLVDFGTRDALGNYHHDGSIQRLPFAGGTPETVVDGIDGPGALQLDGQRLLWSTGTVTASGEQLWSAARADGANRKMLATDVGGAWSQDSEHIYYLQGTGSDKFELRRVAKSGGESELLGVPPQGTWIGLVDGQFVYTLGQGIQAQNLDGSASQPLLANESVLQAVLGEHDIFFIDNGGGTLHSLPKRGGELLTLSIPGPQESSTVPSLQLHREYLYWADVDITDEAFACSGPDCTLTNHVHRAPRVPGETETLLEVTIPKSQALPFAVDDRGLFWVQDGRLLRRPPPQAP